MDLETVAADLYALAPQEFTSARNTRARQARTDGQRDLATAIGDLAKPALAAWVVNMLVRHRADEIDQVLTLGESLREAQESLDAVQMRELTMQRRRLTAAVTSQGRVLAGELGHPVSGAVATQVEATLHAAMVDQGAADAVRDGQLTQPLTASGFGSVDVGSARATPRHHSNGKPSPPSPPAPQAVPDTRRQREQAQAQAQVHEAVELLARVEQQADQAQQAAAAADAHAHELAERLEELRRQVGRHEHELDIAGDERVAAQEQRSTTEEAVDHARRDVREAQRVLDRLA